MTLPGVLQLSLIFAVPLPTQSTTTEGLQRCCLQTMGLCSMGAKTATTVRLVELLLVLMLWGWLVLHLVLLLVLRLVLHCRLVVKLVLVPITVLMLMLLLVPILVYGGWAGKRQTTPCLHQRTPSLLQG
jgi:hypothetical protein